MAEKYFVIFDRREQTAGQVSEQKFELATLQPQKTTAPKYSGNFEDALVAFIEAESVAEAQSAIRHFYPGDVTGTPVVVTAAQFKES